ncbi:MAG: superoxide dismutase [Patescibacteria group bacterium]|nr:superoxide dismutase [Patescibacteria group bacterium]
MNYAEKKFNLPSLEGISDESVKQHLALYAGYVKNFNAMSAQINELAGIDHEKYAIALGELARRRAFEFDGMRLHEHYFAQLEGGTKEISKGGVLTQMLDKEYRGADNLVSMMKLVASVRGPGWAILYWDREAGQPLSGFVGEQHQGHFVTLPILLALDVWEHAYILDYGASGRGTYIDAFFKNLNWGVVESRFAKLSAPER